MAREQRLAWPERLKSTEARERREALKEAAKVGDRAAVNAAIGSLTDRDRTVRLEATRTLATIGGDTALDALLPLLEDPDRDYQSEVARILRATGDGPISRLHTDLGRADTTTRPRVLRRMLALGVTSALGGYLRNLAGPNKEKREEAVELLRLVLPALQIVDTTAEGATGKTNGSRRGAARAAASTEGGAPAAPRPVEPVELISALGDAVGARDSRALELVSHVIGNLRDPLSAELLAACLYHPDAGVRKSAVNALAAQGWMPRTDAERVTFDLARGDERSLARLGADAVEPLRILAENACSDLRASAARSLGLLRRTGAEDSLVRVLGDPVGAVRAAAVNALTECAGPRCARDIARLLKDPDESVRHAVEGSLGRMGEAVRPLLTELAVSSDAAVRSRASRVLSSLGGPQARAL